MSEFEIRYIFNETVNTWIMLFTTYVSIVFAFLVAGSLGAEKFNRVLSGLAVGLFTLSAVVFIPVTTIMDSETLRHLDGVAALEQGSGEPNFAPGILVYAVSLIMVISYIGALVFFLYQRRRARSRILAANV